MKWRTHVAWAVWIVVATMMSMGLILAVDTILTDHAIAATVSDHSRFGVSDMTQVGGLSIWLVHDAAHPSQCLLMVRGVTMTATPWSCQ